MGIIKRNGSTSGRPKFVEGARYYLQYLGMPDTLVYSLNKNKSDYRDDYQSRAEYGNYLYGKPFGPNRNREAKGLGIPIDLSLAFHTDAGITTNDTTVGTLSIYSIEDVDSQFVFPNGVSRLANRDLADIMQTQIVHDVRKEFDPAWNRRQLKDGEYSESMRPNVPSVLIELLSHQNFLDMKYVLDPRFKFEVARAMYKGMLKFLSVQYGNKYIVQPLPVKNFAARFDENNNVKLSWDEVIDTLEATAKPDKYIIYTRVNNGGFDNGIIVNKPEAEIENIEEGKIYSFKVTAVNKGGESFPSEILSVCNMGNNKPTAAIVNNFYRICGPADINSNNFSGFANFIDAGVPDKYDIGFTGTEYNFTPSSPYLSNDEPGHGASHADYETKVIAGNTFDFPYIHGKALMNNGISFISVSSGAVMEKKVNLSKYKLVDLILGEQKATPRQNNIEDSTFGIQFKTFPKDLQHEITNYLSSGGNLFISGAYVGSDIYNSKYSDSTDKAFGLKELKMIFDAEHASNTGIVFSSSSTFLPKDTLQFNVKLNDKIYAVEAPNAISNTKQGETLLRYYDNSFPAAIGYKKEYGVIVFGFPFETVSGDEDRNQIMNSILNYFNIHD